MYEMDNWSPRLEMDSGASGGETGVETTPDAGVQNDSVPAQSEEKTGVNETAAAEPNNFEKAFAKRLSAKQAEWEAQKAEELKGYQDQLKDFDAYKRAATYLQKSADVPDILSLNEQIELLELQERAEQENVPVGVLKRITELEAKELELNEWKKTQEEQSTYASFRQELEKFATENAANADELHQFMFDNQIVKPDIALKAMQATELATRLATAKEDAIKEYLESKKAPRTEGAPGLAATQGVDTSKMSWAEIDRIAAERVRAANNPT